MDKYRLVLLLFVVVPLLSKNGVRGKGLELGADSPLIESQGLEGGGGEGGGGTVLELDWLNGLIDDSLF